MAEWERPEYTRRFEADRAAVQERTVAEAERVAALRRRPPEGKWKPEAMLCNSSNSAPGS